MQSEAMINEQKRLEQHFEAQREIELKKQFDAAEEERKGKESQSQMIRLVPIGSHIQKDQKRHFLAEIDELERLIDIEKPQAQAAAAAEMSTQTVDDEALPPVKTIKRMAYHQRKKQQDPPKRM